MAEVREGERETGDIWFENTFKDWLEFYGSENPHAKKLALEQTLHKASLMEIKDWDKVNSPRVIADSIMKTVPEEVNWWIHKRNEFPTRQIEQNKYDPAFRRVFSVKSELMSRIRRAKNPLHVNS